MSKKNCRPFAHHQTRREGTITRFTRGMLEVDETDDKVQLMTFKAGLKSRDFVASLAKNPPKTMAEALLKA